MDKLDGGLEDLRQVFADDSMIHRVFSPDLHAAKERLNFLESCEDVRGNVPTQTWVNHDVKVDWQGTYYDAKVVAVHPDKMAVEIIYFKDRKMETLDTVNPVFGFKYKKIKRLKRKKKKKVKF